MITKITSAILVGVDMRAVTIEIDLTSEKERSNFSISGSIDSGSASNRISHALKNSGYMIPNSKIIINITPSIKQKEMTHFDLPTAIAILHSLNIISISEDIFKSSIFCGELSLDGSLTDINGALAFTLGAKEINIKNIFLPYECAKECARVEGINVYGIKSLNDIVDFFSGLKKNAPLSYVEKQKNRKHFSIDFADVYGQESAKRVLTIAVAGFHNVLMIGTPGSGKTMLAERTKTIMPELSSKELLETNKIYSIAGALKKNNFIYDRPFRSPHHTISRIGLVGGGSNGQPGEISLAHNGILFLDELTEFSSKTIETLRQPLEQKKVTITRANYSIDLPASFILIAACNPCPCGNYGDFRNKCNCSILIRENYFKKMSGPFLDRIDLQVNVQSVRYEELQTRRIGKTSKEIYSDVKAAIEMQMNRNNGIYNGNLTNQQIKEFCNISSASEKLLEFAFNKLKISARSYHKILKVARTIADLNKSNDIEDSHIKEALLYRSIEVNQ